MEEVLSSENKIVATRTEGDCESVCDFYIFVWIFPIINHL